MSRIKEILHLTAQIKKQCVSMQQRLLLYWLSMLLGIVAALVLILSVFGVFSNDAEKCGEALQLQLNNTQLQLSQHIELMEANSIVLSGQISRTLEQILTANGLTMEDLNDNPELLQELQEDLMPRLYLTLQLSQCSGAYLVLNATTNTNSDSASHSATGIYLRYANITTKGATQQKAVLFRGIPDVARAERIELHNRWNLEFDTDLFPAFDAWMQTESGRLADACAWTDRLRLPDTWEDIQLLCVPIKDQNGKTCGLCGVEISSLYSYLSYPELNSSFGPMITVLAPTQGERLLMNKGMIGSTDGTFLTDADVLTVQKGKYFNTYSSGNNRYIGLHCKTNVQGASGEAMVAAVLLPEATYNVSRNTSRLLNGVFLIALGAAVWFSLFLSKRFVQPILQTIQAIQSDAIPAESETGISELDELMAFLCSKSNAKTPQIPGALPPNIEELFQTFAERAKTLSTAERRILKYYIDGHEITEIPDLAFVSIHTVKKHNSNIYQKLGVSSRDELMLYIELFRRMDRLNELTECV